MSVAVDARIRCLPQAQRFQGSGRVSIAQVLGLIIAAGLIESLLILYQPISALLGLNIAILSGTLLLVNPYAFLCLALLIGPLSFNLLVEQRRELLPSLGGIDPDGLRLIAIIVSGLMLAAADRNLRREITRNRLACAFILVCTLSLLYSPAPMEGLRLLFKICYPLLIYVLVTKYVQAPKKTSGIITCCIASALVTVLAGFVRWLAGGDLYILDAGGIPRLQGALGVGTLGTHLACVSILLFSRSGRSERRRKVELLGSVLAAIGVVATLTRIVVAGLAVALGCAEAVRRRYGRAIMLGGVVLCSAVFLTPLLSRFAYSRDIRELLGLSIGQDIWATLSTVDTSGRGAIWQMIWNDVFLSSPIYGMGLGSTTHRLTEQFGTMMVAHNEYLRILCDTGLIGLCLAVCFAWRLTWRLCRTTLPPEDRFGFLKPMAVGAWACFLICSITDNALELYAVFTGYVATFLGLLSSRYAMISKGEDREQA